VTGVVANRSGGRWLVTPPRVLMAQPGLHAAAVVACGDDRWCLLWWSRTEAGMTVGGLWLNGDGSPRGKPFVVGQDADVQYGHIEAAGAGRDRVFLIWAGVHPERLAHLHTLHAAVLTARPGGTTLVSTGVVGQALTQVMFVPPTVVQVGQGAEIAATTPLVAWRQTSALAATGGETAIVSWLDGSGLKAAGLLRGPGRLDVTPPAVVSADANAGCSPLLAPMAGGSVLAMWAEQQAGIARASCRLLHLAGPQVEPAGGALVLTDGGTQLPRVACAVPSEPGSVIFSWNALGGGDHGLVVAQRVTLAP
jgi:hypothetical protein